MFRQGWLCKVTFTKNRLQIDSTWVVSHNPALLKEYNTHIKVELCNRLRQIKYLFKYMGKGQDQTTFIEDKIPSNVPQGQPNGYIIDEI